MFDEVVTGFRLAYGGAQEYYGVTPDIAAIGKIVGGGFPLAAIVGRREIMEAYDRASAPPDGYVPQVGTLNGNPIAAAAGLATLEVLRQPGLYDAYHARGAALRNALQRLLDEAEVPAVVSGVDVMFDVYFTDQSHRRLPLDAPLRRRDEASLRPRSPRARRLQRAPTSST